MMKPKKTPQRLCSGCQTFQDKKMLVRIVRTPTGEVVIDATGKAPGRGGYVCRNTECIKRACTTKGLDRALKTSVPSGIYDTLKAQIDPS
jgi:predicted RNA-binding protein YlxR (DUF448 family)